MIRTKIEISNNQINIVTGYFKKELEIDHVFHFNQANPIIKVSENGILKREYLFETLKINPDLTDQFFHSTIRVLKNSAIMIDGIISNNLETFPNINDENCEALRLQPFYLSNKENKNLELKGSGLFERGLHFSGTVTSSNVRNICICDNCKKSFSIQHFHAGFSEMQYFYSTDSKETLAIKYGEIENLPTQLQQETDIEVLEKIESQLPKPTNGDGHFKFYNSFRCPHCNSKFIDFENNKKLRSTEYYGNYHINQEIKYLEN
ncbi:hypothetical protein [Gillisia sp. CAL575]|uniref:hypothetical protein n=1 Tax=Gillisia sp. CAL575 TaxID=985255 RepID=UPI0005536E71|nr:hypothetical protein [Gillisia sp. CAL575]